VAAVRPALAHLVAQHAAQHATGHRAQARGRRGLLQRLHRFDMAAAGAHRRRWARLRHRLRRVFRQARGARGKLIRS
jgi:hypothetical protein